MKKILSALVLILFVGVASAQVNEVGISWAASAGATGYKLYCGTQTGVYNAPGYPLDVGNVTAVDPISFQAEGIPFFCVVTAYNAAGESGYSNEVTSFPRPEGVSFQPNCVPNPTPGSGVHCEGILAGFNFAPDLSVSISSPSVLNVSTARTSSRAATVAFDIAADAVGGAVDVVMAQGVLNPITLPGFLTITPVILPAPPDAPNFF